MNLLALDTATEACSAALLRGDTILERYAVCPREHGARILPMIDDLLTEAELTLGGIDLLAYGRGPGAFTGVRIAVGIAQGLAMSNDIPVAGISDLAAIAVRASRIHGTGRVLVLSDARMGEVYAGRFVVEPNHVAADGPEFICAPADVPVPAGTGWLGAGSGWGAYRNELAHLGEAIMTIEPDCLPRAGDIAWLASREAARDAVPAIQAAPVYLRERVVERGPG